jgi:ribosome-interacting GTPase 1
VPKNIFTNRNYQSYLIGAFNKIYDLSAANRTKPMIIFCGGKTDCFKPYRRTEEEEMIRFFKQLAAQPFVKNKTKNWRLVGEGISISTLENLLFSKRIIDKKKIHKANIYIFCETTRERRIKMLAGKIFGKNFKCRVISIDFDVSSNRYLDPKFIVKKEKAEMKHALWSLKSPANLKKHHQVFVEKLDYFRKEGGNHPDAVKKWWDKKLKELE